MVGKRVVTLPYPREARDHSAREVPTDDSILSVMMEGIIVVDLQGCLLRANNAARKLLGLSDQFRLNEKLSEIVNHDRLIAFVDKAILSKSSLEDEFPISIGQDSERLLQAYSRVLSDYAGEEYAVLIVFTDSTRIRHLETVRRDFVANVSHELKTPITSIQGFVETLLDGALHNPADAERFLRIVSRQAERLNKIFEDLLMLAKVEQEEERGVVDLRSGKIIDIIDAAVQNIEYRAVEKGVSLKTMCSAELMAQVNDRLLEQAITNLVENAIKYSDSGDLVEVEGVREGNEVVIKVRDNGCGVSEGQLPRLWERFYRADQARSRKRGGTGLGLSIVKHIAQAHGGYASVESTLGEGSVFSIHLNGETEPAASPT